MTRIKLCGMFREEDIAAVNKARPDYVGFVVNVPRSSRSVGVEQLRKLAAGVDDGIVRVGVFVDETVEQVAQLAEEGTIDVVQLHGNEDDAYIEALRKRTDARIVQAFRVKGADDVRRAEASIADGVLLDSGAGSGATFDWSLAAGCLRLFALAGGLNPENLAQAVRQTNPFAVDLSSGVERDGVKDASLMMAAVAAVRAADRNE